MKSKFTFSSLRKFMYKRLLTYIKLYVSTNLKFSIMCLDIFRWKMACLSNYSIWTQKHILNYTKKKKNPPTRYVIIQVTKNDEWIACWLLYVQRWSNCHACTRETCSQKTILQIGNWFLFRIECHQYTSLCHASPRYVQW